MNGPSTVAPDAPSSTTRALALIHAALVTLGVVAAASAAMLRASALDPGGALPASLHQAAFRGHAIAAQGLLAALPLALVAATRSARRRAWIWASLLMLTGWAALAAASALLPALEASTVRALGVVQAAVGASALDAARPRDERSFWSWGLALIGAAEVLAGLGEIAGSHAAVAVFFELLAAGSIAVAAEHALGRPVARTPLLVFAAAALAPRAEDGSPLAALGLLAGAGALAVSAAWALRASLLRTWSSRWIALAIALMAEGMVLRALLRALSTEVHLHDTLLPVGAAHLAGLAPIAALIGVASRERPRPGGGLDLVLTATGAHAFAWGFVVLGARGNPARYVQYFPQFGGLQRLSSAGAAVLIAGLALAIAGLMARREASR